ncbi:MAG: TonB-dependent receptor [Chitinophagales bacterium]|nr:TonB-dependent receptor [Chitinophagales bacterium]
MKKTILTIYSIIALSTIFAQGVDTTAIAIDPISVDSSKILQQGTGYLNGSVYDEKTSEKIPGASIIIDDNAAGTISDENGFYKLEVPAGWHVVTYSFVGYEARQLRIRIWDGKTHTENVAISTETKQLGLVTVTGSKYEKKIGEEVVSVEVLTPQFIENTNVVNMNQALDKVPGVNMIGEQVNIRGGAGYASGAASRVLMLLDGLPILTPDDGNIEFQSLPLENVEQIEVIKGASSSLYGSSALNGIINLRTANPKNEPYNKITLFYGLYNNPFSGKKKQLYFTDKRPMFGGGSFAHRKRYKQVDLVLGGGYNEDAGYLNDNSSKRVRLNVKVRYRPERVPGLTIGLNTNMSSFKGGFFFLWRGWGDSPEDSIGRPGYIAKDSLAYITNTPGDFRSIPVNLDPYVTYFDQKNNMHSFKGRWYFVRNLNSNGENTDAQQYYGEYTFHSALKRLGLNFVTGASMTYGYINSEIFDKRKNRNGAVFLQIDKKFFDKLSFTVGIRTEMIKLDTLDFVAIPVVRAGVNFQAAEGTYIRGSFGQGYRYPTIAEKYVQTIRAGVQVIPNPDVKPESGWSAELGLKQAMKVTDDWIGYFDIAGFITQYKDMIEFAAVSSGVGLPYFQAQNVTNARISGFEISTFGQGKIKAVTTNFLLGYTYLQPVDLNFDDSATPDKSNMLNYRFHHSAKADIEAIYKGLAIGTTMTYISFMENVDKQIEQVNNIGKFRDANNGGTFVIDGRIAYNLAKGTKVAFIAKNLANKQYTLRPGYMEAPRNYTVQLSYQF